MPRFNEMTDEEILDYSAHRDQLRRESGADIIKAYRLALSGARKEVSAIDEFVGYSPLPTNGRAMHHQALYVASELTGVIARLNESKKELEKIAEETKDMTEDRRLEDLGRYL